MPHPQEVFRLAPRRKQVLEDIQLLASSNKGYRNYKERLRSINPPCVPFVGKYNGRGWVFVLTTPTTGMYLSWIVFIKDGNEGKIKGRPDNFINFKKM